MDEVSAFYVLTHSEEFTKTVLEIWPALIVVFIFGVYVIYKAENDRD